MWGLELLFTGAFLILCFVLGMSEKKKHRKNLEKIPVKINVNGVRGKSTVTRLITGVLHEAGYRTVGKTTGTDARMLYWFEDREEPIKRRLEGPNIGEQKKVVEVTAEKEADALVSECMAVNPDYQITFHEELLQAEIGLIVNVLHDHMDVMGPTLDHVAEAFSGTIPYNGQLIVNESPYVDYFRQIARERNTELIVIDTDEIPESFLKEFKYMVFPENAALAMAVAQILGIDRKTAMKGMLNAWPDPGSMKILPIGDIASPSFFVNGFSANDATSTINIWKRVEELGYPSDDPVIIVNCREDRVDRTEQFARDVLPYIPTTNLILIGGVTRPIVKAYNEGKIEVNELLDLEGHSTEAIIEKLQPFLKNRVIYGIGNIHGSGEPLIHAFEKMAEVRKESA
ncbi:poly-gamma-glutamate synthase PgsB [Salipaludibacillus aurantiacus]|uniref:Poly-gamma-glutamate synthase PgsB/CapB n=1 Tax=Salipaludibacillus aurantiacus TaxID=1601833 RepID=A0A1H9X6P7_9BACI|nr:poly-gamma-glutamate synthase PgsB [Salipaludibacillus aurantiacus]SES41313.1 poly-gamma-glutamate synthase PgsB/CapB [Salipaludibacillus aurantiacus]